MNESHNSTNVAARLKEVESRWLGTFNILVKNLNDAERTDYYRRLRAATALMREYANFVKRKEQYWHPWVGGEFDLAIALLGFVGIAGFGLSFFNWFADVLSFIQSRSLFLTLIAIAVSLSWLRRLIEVETRRASNEIDIGRYAISWRSLGLKWGLLDDNWRWIYLDENERRDLSDDERSNHQVMNVKILCELREALILDVLRQRDIDTSDYLLKKPEWMEFLKLIKEDQA